MIDPLFQTAAIGSLLVKDHNQIYVYPYVGPGTAAAQGEEEDAAV